MSEIVWFNGWANLARIAIVAACAYLALVFVLRISGKRTLSKMNAFDLVITVSIGSTLATIILSKDIALSEGVMALAMLVLLQFVIAWSAVRSGLVRKLLKSDPALVYHGDEFIHSNMRRERVTREEVEAAVRESGLGGLHAVSDVILETDGSVSVIPKEQNVQPSVLPDVS